MTWLQKIRLRVLAIVLGAFLTGLAVASWGLIPLWPVVGVAVAVFAVAVNKVGHRLSQPVCLSCGADLANRPVGEHGMVCPACGAPNPPPFGGTHA